VRRIPGLLSQDRNCDSLPLAGLRVLFIQNFPFLWTSLVKFKTHQLTHL
jgi:hypothetical protein